MPAYCTVNGAVGNRSRVSVAVNGCVVIQRPYLVVGTLTTAIGTQISFYYLPSQRSAKLATSSSSTIDYGKLLKFGHSQ